MAGEMPSAQEMIGVVSDYRKAKKKDWGDEDKYLGGALKSYALTRILSVFQCIVFMYLNAPKGDMYAT